MEESVNKIIVELLDNTQAGFDAIDKRLKGLEGTSDKVSSSFEKAPQRIAQTEGAIAKLAAALRAIGVQMETIDYYFISGFKVVTLFKLIEYLKSTVTEATNVNNAFQGVKAVAESMGVSSQKVFDNINESMKDGLVNIRDTTEAMRNLLKKGYNPEEAKNLLQYIKTTGVAFGTQNQMPLGEATRRVTEGILLDMPRLMDNTRAAKNLNEIWKDYASTLRMNADQLDEVQRRHAVLLYFMKEAKDAMPAYQQNISGLTGSFGQLAVTLNQLKIEFGEGLTPVVREAIVVLNDAFKGISNFIAIITGISQAGMAPFDMMNIAFEGIGKSIAQIGGLTKDWLGYLYDKTKQIYQTGGVNSIITPDTVGRLEKAKAAITDIWSNLNAYVTVANRQTDSLLYKVFGILPPPDVIGAATGATQRDRHTTIGFPDTSSYEAIQNRYGYWKPGARMSWEDQFGARNQDIISQLLNKKDLAEALKKMEELRQSAARLAEDLTKPLKESLGTAIGNLLTGQKGVSILEQARAFGMKLGQSIGDAMAEMLTRPLKNWLQGIMMPLLGSLGSAFTGYGLSGPSTIGSTTGGGGGLGYNQFMFGNQGATSINITPKSGLTAKEISAIVEQEVTKSLTSNGAMRKDFQSMR